MKIPSAAVAQVDLAEALEKGPPPPGNLAVPVFAHGTLEAELYTPRGNDPQTPHERDEVYVVAHGSGVFFNGTGRRPVGLGTFIFVPAGRVHRFEEFSDDFAVWVFFYGPRGGEARG
jgi:mannose-6-phosphate isomerase-like protein (cupin superfamily)